ncbi:hypothetical protein K443DRAFT_14963 [Laccaria amethystina LaAM-08-1]|uniref:Unplaced genomic scaffold K443scaffold_580, whole genome shotgun sequence n=1 Tax=Laccaria amethystina LaAM-08-1 TaxID=1095629 RepID=A0A0C9WZK6_9AGAR|nr:hypothetical protein K443DRAFT_14963 [Laccaria amethystina LaAM-08-1]
MTFAQSNGAQELLFFIGAGICIKGILNGSSPSNSAISRFYVLIAFAVCAAQLASAGVVAEARHVAARAHSYVVNEVREANFDHKHKKHGKHARDDELEDTDLADEHKKHHGRDDAQVDHKKHHKHHGRDDAEADHKKHHKHHGRDNAEVDHKKHHKHHGRDDAQADHKHKKHDKDHKKP